MAGTTKQAWDSTWTASSINGSSVAGGASADSALISLNGEEGIDISVTCAYGATTTEGLQVYVERDIDGTNFEDVTTAFGFRMAFGASATFRKAFSIDAADMSSFRIHVVNGNASAATVTVQTKMRIGAYT